MEIDEMASGSYRTQGHADATNPFRRSHQLWKKVVIMASSSYKARASSLWSTDGTRLG